MKIIYSIITFYFITLLKAEQQYVLKWIGDEFEVKPLKSSTINSKTLICEYCQLFTYAFHNHLEKALQKYKDSIPPKGFLDTTMNNFLERHVACSNTVWQPLADITPQFTIEQFIEICRDSMDDIEEYLEKVGVKKLSLSEEIEQICIPSKACNSKDDLWKINDYPEYRESKNSLLRKRSLEFFEENKKKPNIETTPSGLQYKILYSSGNNKKPSIHDKVAVHYRGKTLDGKEFDASVIRGNKPAEFEVSQLVPGWTEALTMMNEGDEYLIFIPPELAYGERGAGHSIGPNEVIIFKLKLIKIIDDKDGNEVNEEL
ncbi:peptidyl-prolyl cis-trans isomerase, fkbp-type family protein [Cryptosporidium serpentis]